MANIIAMKGMIPAYRLIYTGCYFLKCIPLLLIVGQIYLITCEDHCIRAYFIDLRHGLAEILRFIRQVIDILRARLLRLYGSIKAELRISDLDDHIRLFCT